MTGVLIKRGSLDRDRHTLREDDMKTHKETMAVDQPRPGAAPSSQPVGTSPADTLTSDYQPPELWDNAFLLFL